MFPPGDSAAAPRHLQILFLCTRAAAEHWDVDSSAPPCILQTATPTPIAQRQECDGSGSDVLLVSADDKPDAYALNPKTSLLAPLPWLRFLTLIIGVLGTHFFAVNQRVRGILNHTVPVF